MVTMPFTIWPMSTSLTSFCTTFLMLTALQSYKPLQNFIVYYFLCQVCTYVRAFVPAFYSLTLWILPKRVLGFTYSHNSGLGSNLSSSKKATPDHFSSSCISTLPAILQSSLSHFPILHSTFINIFWELGRKRRVLWIKYEIEVLKWIGLSLQELERGCPNSQKWQKSQRTGLSTQLAVVTRKIKPLHIYNLIIYFMTCFLIL